MDTLLPVLKGIGEALNALLENNWQQKAAAAMASSYEPQRRASKSRKSSATRTRSKKGRPKKEARKGSVKPGKK